MTYMVFGRANGSVLDKREAPLGVIFCDKKSEPFAAGGVYDIVHSGLDKNRRPFSIAVPVLGFNTFREESLFREAENGLSGSIEEARLKRIFPDSDVKGLADLVKLSQQEGIEVVCNAAKTPMDCSDCDFFLPDVKKGEQYSPRGLVFVQYTNGEAEWQQASWVYKNRDRLVNTVITVFGKTATTLCVEFSPA